MKAHVPDDLTIFNAALEIAAPLERAAYIDRACGADAALRQKIVSLLAAYENAGETFDHFGREGATRIQRESSDPERVGSKIGRYKLLQKIGEGGCGAVYMAEQEEPVRRRVALKIIKLGMDTKSVIARFEAERQALALMDHPNIAKVHDAGAAETGRPYFVMELVRGTAITTYCDEKNLSTRERLELFTKVCRAVQHAHQKGIIHRDLKPSNILVSVNDGVAVPKVIDFGIAKATSDQRLTDKTVFTAFEQFIGTPAYMSPEQAEVTNLDVDTRSDIYSLGVLLYELLTGRTPFDASELLKIGLDEMRRTIREREPERPSTRVSTLGAEELTTTAKRRGLDAPKLIGTLRGDLDWIVMKCLEKDRARRYETANGLAMDIQRHLNNETVVARPPSAAYRIHKAWRRNRLIFAAAGAVGLALVIGSTFSVWQALRATHARARAVVSEQAAEVARQRAQTEELIARRQAYAADMNLAQQALAVNNIGRARRLLDRHRPSSGEIDLRGWEWRYLWEQTRPDDHEVHRLSDAPLASLSFSADGHLLAANTSVDPELIITGVRPTQPVLRRGPSEVCTFAHQTPLLAFSLEESPTNHSVVLWDVTRQQPLTSLALPARARQLALSQDDRWLAILSYREAKFAAGTNGGVDLFWMVSMVDVANSALLWQKAVEGPVTFLGRTLAISPDGSLVAVAAHNGGFQLLEMKDGAQRWRVTATSDRVTALAFSPDGTVVISGAGFADSVIRLWDARNGNQLAPLEGHHSWVSDLIFTLDGQRLVSSSGDQTIRLWDWNKRRAVGMRLGHHDEVYGLAIAPDGHTLASRCKDGTLYYWKLGLSGERLPYRTLPFAVWNAVFTADSRSLIVVKRGDNLAAYDPAELVEQRRWPFGSTNNQQSLSIAANARRAALFDRQGSLTVVELGTCEQTTNLLALGEVALACILTANADHLLAEVLTPKGSVVNTAWDTHAWRRTSLPQFGNISQWRQDFPTPAPSLPNSAVIFGQGLTTPAKSEKQILSLLDLETPETRARKFESPGGEPYSVEVSPDGKIAAGAFGDGSVQLWDMRNLHTMNRLKGFLLGVHSVTFSHEGTRLAAGSASLEAIKMWETATWQEVLTLAGQGSMFMRTKFSPDDRFLVSVNVSGVLHLWKAPSLEEIEAAERNPDRASF
jgi:serine/threonine protein kinase/WD40 repeat protein